ncbi:excinuclease ABC subunit UvrA [Erysipelothrix sp. HDW6C]|uniref:excinuclease ABC subunit UvrA n=1 Tax=Erysipelothrix sp. HDW6C TaxID=2714930 RepID=UPI0014088754|nr:excinuclease ABC subunit UvrA [Erysipelothrix sp. HDW6C]QIK68791.1 excinuclease ABC subunit UvrA [Erysipelothrix sp. HDW6C]
MKKRQFDSQIHVRKARMNNLKNIDVDIPLNAFTVITGLSGSGKSSLAIGTLYAEGTRRYLEALSSYTRRRITQASRADVDSIANLPATLALHQRPDIPSIRSTVGTQTEVLNIVRLMFSRLGSHVCPNGHRQKPTLNVAQEMEIVCPICDVHFFGPSAEDFAFNGNGACPECHGNGQVQTIVADLLVPDPTLTINQGAVKPWGLPGRSLMKRLAHEQGLRLDVPFKDLTSEEKHIVLHGKTLKKRIIMPTSTGKAFEMDGVYENAFDAVKHSLEKTENEATASRVNRFLEVRTCPSCHGSRYSPKVITSHLSSKSIAEVSDFDLLELQSFISVIPTTLPKSMHHLSQQLITESLGLIQPIVKLGLDYLTLARNGNTLSTGELQRIQLARTTRNEITGILYVLDEPSVGLHPANTEALIESIEHIIDQGNSVIVVEHDIDIIKEADYIIEIGPDAGANGGQVIAQGTPTEIIQNPSSRIGPYLSGDATIVVRERVNLADYFTIEVKDLFNIIDAQASFMYHGLNLVTGVSGSGKSSMIFDSLVPAFQNLVKKQNNQTHAILHNANNFDDIVMIDASPVGKNVRSSVATYMKTMDNIRHVFAATDAAHDHNLSYADFSYNNKSGACPYCSGIGTVTFDVQYLPDISEVCPVCNGDRYNPNVLAITYKEKTIAEVLRLTVAQAITFFSDDSSIIKDLRILSDIGLDYLTLGESTLSLSGGESQRLKLSTYLGKKHMETLFVFDEPTTGLHPQDVKVLIGVFQRLISRNATIIAIDHDLDLIANGDHIVDMGPGGGKYGGNVIAQGDVRTLANDPKSVTGKYLKEHLNFYQTF